MAEVADAGPVEDPGTKDRDANAKDGAGASESKGTPTGDSAAARAKHAEEEVTQRGSIPGKR